MSIFENPQTIMPVLYPALGAACLFLSAALFATYHWLDRVPVIVCLATHFLIEAATIFLLALSTGHNPVLDIEPLRVWIVVTRLVMLVNLVITAALQVRRFRQLGRLS